MKEYTLIIEQNTDGFWGQIVEYPNVFTSGETLDELKHNSREAMDLYLTSIGETTEEEVDFKIVVDLQEFFKMNDYINVSKLAKRTGMNTSLLRQYSRGIKFPSMEQVARIEKSIQEIGRDLSNIHLLNKPIELQ